MPENTGAGFGAGLYLIGKATQSTSTGSGVQTPYAARYACEHEE
jgi:hypothetical protein